MQLNYTLPALDRLNLVNKILQKNPSPSEQYLSYMSDYLLFTNDKNQTKKEQKMDSPILTKNREITINKRQVSYEGIVASLENDEDKLFNLISNNKNQILDPKDQITQSDIDSNPILQSYFNTLKNLQQQFSNPSNTGPQKFALKKAIIETWQQIYIIKASQKTALSSPKAAPPLKSLTSLDLTEHIHLNEDLIPISDGKLTLLNPSHISFLLCYYSQLKQECWDNLQSDMWYLLLDLEDLIYRCLKPSYPFLFSLLVYKIDGLTNEQIQKIMLQQWGEWHSEQYYSNLWRQRIPKLLLEQAQKDYLIWYYTNVEKGYWKKCTKCGSIKLGHQLFFARNSSKDGWYSQCKECKNKKKGK